LSKNDISRSWASGPVSTPEASCHDPEVWSRDDWYQGEDIPLLECPILDTNDLFVVYFRNTGTTEITIEYSTFGWVWRQNPGLRIRHKATVVLGGIIFPTEDYACIILGVEGSIFLEIEITVLLPCRKVVRMVLSRNKRKIPTQHKQCSSRTRTPESIYWPSHPQSFLEVCSIIPTQIM
jgi:hypothetical protein